MIKELSPSAEKDVFQVTNISCLHTITDCKSAILSLLVNDHYIFAGTSSGLIYIYSLDLFKPVQVLKGDHKNVFSLVHSEKYALLCASTGQNSISCWCTSSIPFKKQAVVILSPDNGDIFGMLYCDDLNALYLGCQDGSIQMVNFYCSCKGQEMEHSVEDSKFFRKRSSSRTELDSVEKYYISNENIYQLAHNGVVYGLVEIPFPGVHKPCIASFGCDGKVSFWLRDSIGLLTLIKSIECHDGAIYSLDYKEGLLFVGLQEGGFKVTIVYDFETFQCIYYITLKYQDVNYINAVGNIVFAFQNDASIKIIDMRYQSEENVKAHEANISCAVLRDKMLVTGCQSGDIKLWTLVTENESSPITSSKYDMMEVFKRFVSYKTVSLDENCRADSRKCAKFLKNLLLHFGADAKLVSIEGKNPMVLGKYLLKSSPICPASSPIRILFYGHYDVQPADFENWQSNPFELTGRDGYLYGRGATDNKGPIVAFIYSLFELRGNSCVNAEIVFVIEGEEEASSEGFAEALKQNESYIGPIDVVLLSNSYWIDDRTPCLTYGTRGVIHANVTVTNNLTSDQHSGVFGGGVREPIKDLVQLLSTCFDDNERVLISGFYDNVTPFTDEEKILYDNLSKRIAEPEVVPNLIKRWREPTWSIHSIESGGSGNSTVIPSSVSASVSMRIVPNQDLQSIQDYFIKHIKEQFAKMKTTNELRVKITDASNYWLSDPSNSIYLAAEEAIKEVWGCNPIYIREGGSIPTVAFLEQFFKAKVIHIPIGQSSDHAHLENERIRLLNFTNGKLVFERFIENCYHSYNKIN